MNLITVFQVFPTFIFEFSFKVAINLSKSYIHPNIIHSRSTANNNAKLFKNAGGEFYFVELSADLETRLERNETPHRMERKVSKRDVVWSKANLLKDASNHRLNSEDGEVWFENHMKIDNSNLLPDEVADMIIEKYKLVANVKEEKEYRFGV